MLVPSLQDVRLIIVARIGIHGLVGRPPYELRCCRWPESEYEPGSADEFGRVEFGEFRTLDALPTPSNMDVRSPAVLE
jgi:hypothetical protein